MWSFILFLVVSSLHWTTGAEVTRGFYRAYINDSYPKTLMNVSIVRSSHPRMGNSEMNRVPQRTLDLSRLEIQEIADSAFNDVGKIEHLNLTENKIENLPRHVFRSLINLKNLSLSYNYLQTFDVDFTGLNKLAFLDISYNEIVHFTNREKLNLPSSTVILMEGNLPRKDEIKIRASMIQSVFSYIKTLVSNITNIE